MTNLQYLILADLILGAIAVAIFQYRNPQRDFIHWVSACVFLIMAMNPFLLWLDLDFIPTLFVLFFVNVGLGYAYFLRFRKKKDPGRIDYLKWVALVLIMFQPTTILQFGEIPDLILRTLNILAIPVVTIIYIYDRFILKSINEK